MKKLFLLLFGLSVAASMFAQPADPYGVKWYDSHATNGFSRVDFNLPTTDIYQNELDMTNLGYRIFIDDETEPFVFTPEEYEELNWNTTDIYYWIYDNSANNFHGNHVYFFRTNWETDEPFFTKRIGVQAVYNDGGDISYSKIVYTWITDLPTPLNPTIQDWVDSGANLITDPETDEIVGYDMQSQVMHQIGMDMYQRPVANDYTIMKEIMDEEYTVLDQAKLKYSFFTDNDKQFVFTPDVYPNLFQDVYPNQSEATLVPFGYEGGIIEYWFTHFKLTNKVENLIENGFDVDPFFNWRIGIQTYYSDNGMTTTSDIVYMEIFPQLKPAADVTASSFMADWSCDAPNTYMNEGFTGYYTLYVINKETQEVVLTQNVEPVNTYQDEWGNENPLPGATYMVEGLEPGTYQFYVEADYGYTHVYQSVVQEVTLGSHGYDLGDVNHDHKVTINDVTFLIDYLLGNDNGACPICANANGDNGITIADVTALIDILLSGN